MQAAIYARLARLPLYTYAQMSSKHGVQKQSHRGARSAGLASSEKQGLQWYGTLPSGRAKSSRRPHVKPERQRQGLVWYGRLSKDSVASV